MDINYDRKLDPLGDGKSSIQLISSMGCDLDIVNDARVSYNSYSSEWSEKDQKLLEYLINHQHYSVLRGIVFKFRVKAPLNIARQWWKHVIASSHNDDQLQHNEVSFRYTAAVDDEDYYIPPSFKSQSKINHQGSGNSLSSGKQLDATLFYKAACEGSYLTYRQLLDLGVSREQARMVLNPAFYTSWVWTTSLQATLNFLQLRLGEGAQYEIVKYAEAVKELITPVVPNTIKTIFPSLEEQTTLESF